MAKENFFTNSVNVILKKFLSVEENKSRDISSPQKILIVRQHNQLGDLLAGVSLFRALKETYPGSHLTLVLSPDNYTGMTKNRLLDRIYVFDKKKFFNISYLVKTFRLFREEYDLAIIPATVSISFTSNLLARISKSKIRIGVKSLDGKQDKSYYLFDRRIDLDWRRYPDSNVAERILDIVRPFGINTENYHSEINFNGKDSEEAEKFIEDNFGVNKSDSDLHRRKYLIGLHVGAGKKNNRWSLAKYSTLIEKLNENYPADFFLTGTGDDKEEMDYLIKNMNVKFGMFINKPITQVAALISSADLFISNDTGIMHVAGTTKTPQISIFGPTNPFNWAPIGSNKFFIRKSELIDDVTIEDVYHLCEIILNKTERHK